MSVSPVRVSRSQRGEADDDRSGFAGAVVRVVVLPANAVAAGGHDRCVGRTLLGARRNQDAGLGPVRQAGTGDRERRGDIRRIGSRSAR